VLPRNCFHRRRSNSHRTVNQKIHNIFNHEKINKSVASVLNDELVYFFQKYYWNSSEANYEMCQLKGKSEVE